MIHLHVHVTRHTYTVVSYHEACPVWPGGMTHIHTCTCTNMYMYSMYLHVVYMYSMYSMYVHVQYVRTCTVCTYMYSMYVHVQYVRTCTVCTYMYSMYVHVQYVQYVRTRTLYMICNNNRSTCRLHSSDPTQTDLDIRTCKSFPTCI